MSFDEAWNKAQWIDGMATLDARLPKVRELCRTIMKAYGPNDPTAVAGAFQRWVRDAIRYVPDGPGEELSDSQQTIEKGAGDCDDKSRLFTALCRSAKLDASIVPVFRGPDFVHVQARVSLMWPDRWDGGPHGHRLIYARKWVPVELIVKGVELGKLPPRGPLILS